MPKPDSALKDWIADYSNSVKMFAHDFRNPISAIITNLSYVKSVLQDADNDTLEAVEDSVQATNSLLAMIGNFMQIGRLEAGEHLDLGFVKLDEFVARSVERCRLLFSASSPLIEIEDGIVPHVCEWEIPYAELALDNLIITASRYSPTGGTVKVNAGVEGNNVLFVVRDQGAPITKEHQDHIFTKSHQSQSKSDVGSRYGRALGLYAVGLAANFLRGRATVGDTEGGQAFELMLPDVPPSSED